jgi:hypothetical protein
MSLQTRSILSNLCFAAGALYLCISRGGLLPCAVFIGLLCLSAYIRTRPPGLRSLGRRSKLVHCFLAIPLIACFWAGYFYHLVWLQVIVLLIAIFDGAHNDHLSIREYNASHAP